MIPEQGSGLFAVVSDAVAPPAPHVPPAVTPVSDELPADQFEALIRMGRDRGGLTQDDVMTVLRSVELSAELITEVVTRIREAGIEFTYDTGETTVVPMTGAVADDVSGRLRDGFPFLDGAAPAAPTESVPPPARIVALDSGRSSARRSPGAAVPGEVDGVAGRPVKKERAPRRSPAKEAYSDGDGFRGSSADPVHMYLKEIGKVKLLDAALEVELAERIVAGNEAAARLADYEARGRPIPIGSPIARSPVGASRPRRP